MAMPQKTIWESFLSPVVRLLIDEEALKRYALSIDWEQESDLLKAAALSAKHPVRDTLSHP